MRLLTSLSLALASLLAACSSSAPAPLPPPEPIGAAVAILTAAPIPTAAPLPGAAPAADPPSPYFPRIVHAGSSFAYHPLESGGVAIDGSFLSAPILVDEKGARIARDFYKGLQGVGEENAFIVLHVGGDWPRSGHLSLNQPGERGGTDVDYAWTGSVWAKTPSQPLGDMPKDVVRAYYGGTFMGEATWGGRPLYQLFRTGEADDADLVLGGKGKKGRPPTVARGTGECPTRLAGYAYLGNLPSGDLVGLGKLCTSKADYQYLGQPGPGALAVERWTKGAVTSVVEELPGTTGKGRIVQRDGGFLHRSATESYAYTTFDPESDAPTPYVALRDGKEWTDVSPPVKQALRELWAGSDGALWARFTRELWRRRRGAWEKTMPDAAQGDVAWRSTAPDGTLWARLGEDLWHLGATGAWEKAILPRDGGGQRFLADAVFFQNGAMLIVARGGGDTESALFGSTRPDTVLDLAVEEPSRTGKPSRPPMVFGQVKPPSPGCRNLFAVLYKLSRTAPADYDFPLTREALKGHTELSDVRFAETEDGGQRYLVAFVPSLARGQKLVALVREKVQSARPQLLCGEPPTTRRTLKINLRTGALEK